MLVFSSKSQVRLSGTTKKTAEIMNVQLLPRREARGVQTARERMVKPCSRIIMMERLLSACRMYLTKSTRLLMTNWEARLADRKMASVKRKVRFLNTVATIVRHGSGFLGGGGMEGSLIWVKVTMEGSTVRGMMRA